MDSAIGRRTEGVRSDERRRGGVETVDHEPVRIVLGETESGAGTLQLVLAGEGFHIVGQASSDGELERVVAGARPSVIVVDAGISAEAALDARELAGGAAMVAVWPAGVAAVVAEERVDPECAPQELGDAVRRAADRRLLRREALRTAALERAVRRRAALETGADRADGLPEEHEDAGLGSALAANELFDQEALSSGIGSETGRASSARPRHSVPIMVITCVLYLSIVTAFASPLPKAIDHFLGLRGGRPSQAAATSAAGASTAPSQGSEGTATASASDPSESSIEGRNGPRASVGIGTRPGNGDDTGNEAATGNGNGNAVGLGRGRPDDPGAQGHGHGNNAGHDGHGPEPGGQDVPGGNNIPGNGAHDEHGTGSGHGSGGGHASAGGGAGGGGEAAHGSGGEGGDAGDGAGAGHGSGGGHEGGGDQSETENGQGTRGRSTGSASEIVEDLPEGSDGE